jgi:hypothetical protein
VGCKAEKYKARDKQKENAEQVTHKNSHMRLEPTLNANRRETWKVTTWTRNREWSWNDFRINLQQHVREV